MNPILPTVLLLAIPSLPPILPEASSLDRALEEIAPRAEGIAQVDVVGVREVHENFCSTETYTEIRFRILRSTGATRDIIHVMTSMTGLGPDGPIHFEPHGPVCDDDFQNRRRYWVAFSSQYEWDRFPQGIVAWWPDERAPKVLDEAIRADRYADQPQYDPMSGLTHGYRVDKDKGVWRVRLERDGARLWEIELPGRKFEAGMVWGARPDCPCDWRLIRKRWSRELQSWTSVLEHADDNTSGWYLFAEGLCRLDDANPYGVPAGEHRITWALDADTGRTAAIWVAVRLDVGPTSTPGKVRYYDTKSGRLRREEMYEGLEHGGIAAGNEKEEWFRKLVRTFDPATGELMSEESYRHASTPHGNDFVPVRK